MISIVVGSGAIREDQAFISPVVCLSHRRVNADVGGNPGKNDVLNAFLVQKHVEIRGVERTFSRFVDHRFALLRSKLRDNLPAGLTARENPAARSGVSDSSADPPAAPSLVFRKIR